MNKYTTRNAQKNRVQNFDIGENVQASEIKWHKTGLFIMLETKILKEDVSLEPHTKQCSFTFQEAEITGIPQKQIKGIS